MSLFHLNLVEGFLLGFVTNLQLKNVFKWDVDL